MANNEQVAPLARATLISGMTIAFEAIDATTGAQVSGVVIETAAIYGDDGLETGAELTVTSVKPDAPPPLWASLPSL